MIKREQNTLTSQKRRRRNKSLPLALKGMRKTMENKKLSTLPHLRPKPIEIPSPKKKFIYNKNHVKMMSITSCPNRSKNFFFKKKFL